MNLYTNDHRLGRSAHLFLKEWQSRRYLEWHAGAEVALRREGVLARTADGHRSWSALLQELRRWGLAAMFRAVLLHRPGGCADPKCEAEFPHPSCVEQLFPAPSPFGHPALFDRYEIAWRGAARCSVVR
jgi:hypothetical protein